MPFDLLSIEDVWDQYTPDSSSIRSDLMPLIPERRQWEPTTVYFRYGDNITVRLPREPAIVQPGSSHEISEESTTIRVGPALSGLRSYLDSPVLEPKRRRAPASLFDQRFGENIRVRLPPVSSGVKSDLKPTIPEDGEGQASSIDPRAPYVYSVEPTPITCLPALPSPEQRKALLEINLKAQPYKHHNSGCTRKDNRPNRGQPPPTPPTLRSRKPLPLIVRN